MVTRKKKKNPPGTRDKNISNHRPGEKKNIIGQKERKRQPRHTTWKKSKDMQSVGQKKTKPSVNTAMLQLQECSTLYIYIYIYIYIIVERSQISTSLTYYCSLFQKKPQPYRQILDYDCILYPGVRPWTQIKKGVLNMARSCIRWWD